MKTNKSSTFEWPSMQTTSSNTKRIAKDNNDASNGENYSYEVKTSFALIDYKASSQEKFNDEWSANISGDTSVATTKRDTTQTSNQQMRNQRTSEQSGQRRIVQKDDVLERTFMNGLIKHTAIALAIIIPLAAFSAYAAPVPQTSTDVKNEAAITTDKTTNKNMTASMAVAPAAIIYESAKQPTTVDSVDLSKYAGKWYEIGRLPMYFQRNCASNVTATYTQKTDDSNINVLNQCLESDGTSITAEGLAIPADDTGSKLKVSFLPSWMRWLPVGQADYWVLARDPGYQTALVGTPDHEYLWLLARSPDISQETYAKYRKIAQEQGYNLKEFKLTPQNNQTVNLVP
ncbi:lipocalin family protein [uncultured Psychrobacter sp.]|uniref:lipocalin family protein n=1 Tax=uncultured Psychrobacter sp. TaxID=259303 RepID=UPI00345A943E